jgi:hypothetical protein
VQLVWGHLRTLNGLPSGLLHSFSFLSEILYSKSVSQRRSEYREEGPKGGEVGDHHSILSQLENDSHLFSLLFLLLSQKVK